MTYANPIDRDDGKVRGAARGHASGCGFGGRAPIDHHKFKPEHLPSPPASGRSLRGGCAVRRQTGARAGGNAGILNSAIRPTRLNDIAELRRVGLSGADARAAAQNLDRGLQLAVQAITAELPRVHSSKSSVRRRLDSHDANENGLPHAQGSFAPGAKAYD